MASAICLHFSMQGEDTLEQTNASIICVHFSQPLYNIIEPHNVIDIIEHTCAKISIYCRLLAAWALFCLIIN